MGSGESQPVFAVPGGSTLSQRLGTAIPYSTSITASTATCAGDGLAIYVTISGVLK